MVTMCQIGVHIGATWRIRLNCPYAAAMQPSQITLSTSPQELRKLTILVQCTIATDYLVANETAFHLFNATDNI